MKTILSMVIFGLLFSVNLFVLPTAMAAGLPMVSERGVTPSVLASRIERSLRLDPAGHFVISGTKCTTPTHFFDAVREFHPGAKLKRLGELPAYLRSLRFEESPGSENVKMSRIQHEKYGEVDSCKLDLEGWSRTFRKKEGCWRDDNLGECVLASDCGNVVAPLTPQVTASPFKGGQPGRIISSGVCSTYAVDVHVITSSSLSASLLKDVKKMAGITRGFVGVAVSNDMGPEIKGKGKHVTTSLPVYVGLVPVSPEGNVDLGEAGDLKRVDTLDGKAHGMFSKEEAQGNVLRFIFVDTTTAIYDSPARADETGFREIWVWPSEWNNGSCAKYIVAVVTDR